MAAPLHVGSLAQGNDRPLSADAWLVIGFAVLLAAYALWGVFAAREIPMDGWDDWSIWSRKAEILTSQGSLIEGFFSAPTYVFMHQDYPLLYPVWEAIHYRAAGAIDTQAIHAHIWLLLIAFVWGAAYLVRDVVRPVVWAPLLLAIAAAPGVWSHLLSAYADVPVAFFGGLGTLATGLWLADGRRAHLALSALMLAAAANTKNEGLMVAAAVLAAAGAVTLLTRRSDLRAWAIAMVGVVVAILPWRIWMAINDVKGDLPLSKGLDPGYLVDRSDRIRPAIRAINGQLSDQGTWLYLLPLAELPTDLMNA